MSGPAWWESLRAQFPFLRDHAYVWWGGQSPLAVSVGARLTRAIANWDADPLSIERNEWAAFEGARVAAAELAGCSPRRVIVSESTSQSMGLAADMILAQVKGGSAASANVVLHWECHPASSYAWLNAKRRGWPIELRSAEPDAKDSGAGSLLAAVDRHTIAVVVTDVSYLTGERLRLEPVFEARRGRPWALVIDSAQSAGARPLDGHVEFADFVGYPAYKWLFGAPGVGFLVASEQWLDRSIPPMVGWAATKDPARINAAVYDPPDGGAGYRFGMPDLLALGAAEEGLRLAVSASPNRVADRIALLTARLLEGIRRAGYVSPTPDDPEQRAGIVTLDVADADLVTAELVKDRIITVPEQGRVRLDLHAANSEDDVDHIIHRLGELPAEMRLPRPA